MLKHYAIIFLEMKMLETYADRNNCWAWGFTMHLTSLMRHGFEGIGIQWTMLAGILPIAVLLNGNMLGYGIII